MTSRNVRFEGDGGSRPSRGHGQRRSDGSGIAADFESPRYSNAQLQEALAKAIEARDDWQSKAYDLDKSLAKKTKELKEVKESEAQWQAQWRAEKAHNENLTQEKRRLEDTNKDLRAQIQELTEKHKISKPSGTSSSPPTDSFKRRNSVGGAKKQPPPQKERPREPEVASKEKLAQRFVSSEDRRGDDSDRSGGSNKSHRSRRQSHIEPFGPGAQRPIPMPVPSSPTTARQFPSYNTTPQYAPQFTPMQEPVVGRVPRTVRRPSVTVYNDNAVFDEYNGDYHPYPL